MKTQLKAQLLQHLVSKKKGNEGFTLIELLVVIIIIGILSAIALPAFLNQANRARQSEAVTYVGSINRAQQAFRLESRDFAENINDLGLGVPTSTEFYLYGNSNTGDVAGKGSTAMLTNFSSGAAIYAAPLDTAILGYGGATFIRQVETGGEATTDAILCTSKTPGQIGAATPSDLGTADAGVTFADTKEDVCN